MAKMEIVDENTGVALYVAGSDILFSERVKKAIEQIVTDELNASGFEEVRVLCDVKIDEQAEYLNDVVVDCKVKVRDPKFKLMVDTMKEIGLR